MMTGLIVFAILATAGAPDVAAGDAPIVRGIVLGEGVPLAGVPVSDGYRVVLTGEDGRFAIPMAQIWTVYR